MQSSETFKGMRKREKKKLKIYRAKKIYLIQLLQREKKIGICYTRTPQKKNRESERQQFVRILRKIALDFSNLQVLLVRGFSFELAKAKDAKKCQRCTE